MRMLLAVVLLVAVTWCGCGGRKASVASSGHFSSVPMGTQKLIVTPETGLVGKVVKLNAAARFVVLNFPIGRLPAVEQPMSVYRRGLKTAEVRVTGPQQDDNIVADIVAGDVQVGDEVRSD